jgi:hypothetical protein
MVLAVGLKLGFRGSTEAKGFDFAGRIGQAFLQNGFVLEHYPRDVNLERMGGVRGNCRVVVMNASPLGHHVDAVKRSAQSGERVFFIYQNIRYTDQPRWRTLVDHYWGRLNRIIGRLIVLSPVLGVVESAGCGPTQTAWLEKLQLP